MSQKGDSPLLASTGDKLVYTERAMVLCSSPPYTKFIHLHLVTKLMTDPSVSELDLIVLMKQSEIIYTAK